VDEFFNVFRDDPLNIPKCREAVEALITLPESAPVAARAREFLETESNDEVRTWAISVLLGRPDSVTFDTLLELVRSVVDPTERRRSKFARLFTLKALHQLADTPHREKLFDDLLAERWADPQEDALPRNMAAALGTLRGDYVARETLDRICVEVRSSGSYWAIWALLRALGECPPGPADGPLAVIARFELMGLIRGSDYPDHRHSAIDLLGRFPPSPQVVRGLGEILVGDESEQLRLRAAATLKVLADEGASRDLVLAASDTNAEVRVQAVEALKRSLGANRAIRAMVESAMEPNVTGNRFSRLVDALRILDRDGSRSTELLRKELSSDDRDRAQCAERILFDLGGSSQRAAGNEPSLAARRADSLRGASSVVRPSLPRPLFERINRGVAKRLRSALRDYYRRDVRFGRFADLPKGQVFRVEASTLFSRDVEVISFTFHAGTNVNTALDIDAFFEIRENIAEELGFLMTETDVFDEIKRYLAESVYADNRGNYVPYSLLITSHLKTAEEANEGVLADSLISFSVNSADPGHYQVDDITHSRADFDATVKKVRPILEASRLASVDPIVEDLGAAAHTPAASERSLILHALSAQLVREPHPEEWFRATLGDEFVGALGLHGTTYEYAAAAIALADREGWAKKPPWLVQVVSALPPTPPLVQISERLQRSPPAPFQLRSDEGSRQMRPFLCHSSGDKPAVRELYLRLRADGFDPWLDEQTILPGQDWDEEIRKAVREADVVIVCLSRQSTTERGYVQKEIKYVLDVAEEQPDGTIFVIPARLEECDVPGRLRRWQWVNLYEEQGYSRLMMALRATDDLLFKEATS
jgi:nucleotide-binding universal stress UspA family protein